MKSTSKVKVFIVFFFILYFSTLVKSQTNLPFFGNQKLLNGFSKEISGQSLSYFSVYQDVAKEALLTRCTDGNMAIEWLTDSIPKTFKDEYAYFSWIAALSSGTSSGERYFDLYINDQYVLTLTTKEKQYPKIINASANDSTSLVFELQTKDRANDSHGFCYLRVPKSRLEKGKVLKLKLVGKNQKSNDWMMTFKYSFKESISFEVLPFILKNTGKQVLHLNVMHFGKDEILHLQIGEFPPVQFTVHNGYNSLETYLNTVENPVKYKVKATIGNHFESISELELTPIKKREINLIHHSHTDIGYSDYQWNVEKIHTNNIFQALKMIEKTKNYPVESRFKWNIESLWAVENFLNNASKEEKELFFTNIKAGNISLNGFYINILTGLCSPQELDWLFEYGEKLKRENGISIQSVMFCDIPGLNWGIVDAMAKQNIRYFLNGPNFSGGAPDYGDRIGSTIRKFGDKPFWWVSHIGKDSVLFWTGFKGYSSFHQLSIGAVHQRGEKMIAENMYRMDTSNYPYDIVVWNYNIVSDNAPIDSTISDFVKNWNEKYDWPKLQLTTVPEFMSRFEKRFGNTIPSLSGDYSPYWEDGAYSTAKEEARTRELSNKLTQLENYAKQSGQKIEPNTLYRAHRSILMFHEHTWGSWSSISDPDSEFSTKQWEYKKAFLDSAESVIAEIEKYLFRNKYLQYTAMYEIINTLDFDRSEYVELDIKIAANFNAVLDNNKKKIESQKLSNGNLLFFAKDIPKNSYKSVYLIVDKKKVKPSKHQFKTKLSNTAESSKTELMVFYNQKWVSFGQMFRLMYVYKTDPSENYFDSLIEVKILEDGNLLKRYQLKYTLKSCKDIVIIVSDFADTEEIKLEIKLNKEAVREKESIHFLMDFALENPQIHYGINDTFVNPANGLLSASNYEYFSVQRWIDISNETFAVTVNSPQMALFEVDEVVNENRDKQGKRIWKENFSASSKVYVYVLNNYWHTNYKADQEGNIHFEVNLLLHNTFSNQQSNTFGKSKQQTFLIVPTYIFIGTPSF